MMSARREFELRAYQLGENGRLIGHSIANAEGGVTERLYIARIRRDGKIIDASPDLVLRAGDILAVFGKREVTMKTVRPRAAGIEDRELLDMPVESVDVYVTSCDHAGRPLRELSVLAAPRGVFLRSIRHNGAEVPLRPETVIDRGDMVALLGPTMHVDVAARSLGYADGVTTTTDVVFFGLDVVLGRLIGLPAILVGIGAIGLSQSVGVWVFRWSRSVHPTFGRIPDATLWLFESLGLAGFTAVVAAIIVSLVSHLVGVFVGYYPFGIHPGVVLSVCAGADTTTPGLAAIQEAADSRILTLGYVLLAFCDTVMVSLLN